MKFRFSLKSFSFSIEHCFVLCAALTLYPYFSGNSFLTPSFFAFWFGTTFLGISKWAELQECMNAVSNGQPNKRNFVKGDHNFYAQDIFAAPEAPPMVASEESDDDLKKYIKWDLEPPQKDTPKTQRPRIPPGR